MKVLKISGELDLQSFLDFTFSPEAFSDIQISENLLQKSDQNFLRLNELMKQGAPIYGVTTGFGDNATHYVDYTQAQRLQENLVNYLSCGLGPILPIPASRAMFLARLNSLAQGISAVSSELLLHMKMVLKHDILPVVPCEGSLGASGDLIPLAYLAQTLQGKGNVFYKGNIGPASEVFKSVGLPFYKLKPKEGLALVNGTSTMVGLAAVNLKNIERLIELAQMTTALQCLVLDGKKEAFSAFINEVAKKNPGQKEVARQVRDLLEAEKYSPKRGQETAVIPVAGGEDKAKTEHYVQDRYSLRCVPQILGPIVDYQKTAWSILNYEVNSVSDNPVIDDDGLLEMGGNFYGGYLSQAMDMSKINLAHIADLVDRQIMMLFDERTRKDLSPNLIDQQNIPDSEHHLHHGLKGLHQAASALTSEILQKAIPNGIFSRSSESHNQDKVSLGMSSAVTCQHMVDGVFKMLALQLVCLCQAVDIKNIHLKSPVLQNIYKKVRLHIPRISQDVALGESLQKFITALQSEALLLKQATK